MAGTTPVRLIRNEFELEDLIDRLDRDSALIERDATAAKLVLARLSSLLP
jgi:hypothetical protein